MKKKSRRRFSECGGTEIWALRGDIEEGYINKGLNGLADIPLCRKDAVWPYGRGLSVEIRPNRPHGISSRAPFAWIGHRAYRQGPFLPESAKRHIDKGPFCPDRPNGISTRALFARIGQRAYRQGPLGPNSSEGYIAKKNQQRVHR